MVPVWLVCDADKEHAGADALQDLGAELVPVPVNAEGMLAIEDVLQHARQSRHHARVGRRRSLGRARACSMPTLIDEAAIYQGPRAVGEGGLQPFVTEGLDPGDRKRAFHPG